jgi:steroid 5-alpha reductase family enzyme
MIRLLILSTLAMTLVMLVGWAFQRARNNGGWTDVFWTFGLGLVGIAAALFPLQPGPPATRQWLVAALVGAWSLRLGLHIALRVGRSAEDARYADMRRQFGQRFQLVMALFLPAQAIISIPLLAAILLAARRPGEGLGAGDVLGVLILVAAVLGEGAADRQLEAFKADPASRGRVCDVGLWGWSRHPNYFFEWLGWLAYPAIAIDLTGGFPEGWASLMGPLAMFLILNFATGVPPLEAHMLRSRGEAFRDYQRRTSAFFPLPPKPKTERKGA